MLLLESVRTRWWSNKHHFTHTEWCCQQRRLTVPSTATWNRSRYWYTCSVNKGGGRESYPRSKEHHLCDQLWRDYDQQIGWSFRANGWCLEQLRLPYCSGCWRGIPRYVICSVGTRWNATVSIRRQTFFEEDVPRNIERVRTDNTFSSQVKIKYIC